MANRGRLRLPIGAENTLDPCAIEGGGGNTLKSIAKLIEDQRGTLLLVMGHFRLWQDPN
jgi:hypothetical protein